jgi:hypothetical protein
MRHSLEDDAILDVRVALSKAIDLVALEFCAHQRLSDSESRALFEYSSLVDDDAAIDLARLVVTRNALKEFVGPAQIPRCAVAVTVGAHALAVVTG